MTRPVVRRWTLNLSITLDRNHKTPLWRQLANQLIQEIARNRLVPGAALPGTRELASDLCINRKTVVTAYDELIAQGWLRSDPKSGTFVSTLPPDAPQNKVRTKRLVERNDYSLNVARVDIPTVPGGPPTKSFDDGLPDTRLMPAEILGRAYRSAVLSGSRNNIRQYGDPRGYCGLRDAIAEMVNSERGLSVTRDNICTTRGSQMAIFLAARVLAGPGQCIAMDALTYPPAFHAFKAMGAEIIPVRLDHEGLNVDHLEELCRRHPIRSIYVTPHRQYPTTVTLSPQRRTRLISLAQERGLSIIEDDYDHEFNFVSGPMLPIASLAPFSVVYIGSFSKVLSPTLRVGYIVASKRTIDALAQQILLVDRQGDLTTEQAVTELIESGELRRHIRRSLPVYTDRRDLFASLLADHFGDEIRVSVPTGGLAFWVEFGDRSALDDLEERARSRSFQLMASDSFCLDASGRRGLRLGFASKNRHEMTEATRALRSFAE